MNKLGGLMVAMVWLASGAALADKAAPVGKISAPVAAPMAAAENPCTALTPAAIQGAIDRMDQARAEAQLEYDAYGTSGGYPAASQQGLDYITQAMNQMVFLREWLPPNVP